MRHAALLHVLLTAPVCVDGRFEKRFQERASLKGKDHKEELKDAEARSFLSDLVDDTLAVLGLPHFGVAEEVLGGLWSRFSSLAFRVPQCISAAHKAMMIDIIAATFFGLVKFTHRAHDLDLKVDLYPSTSAPGTQEGSSDHLLRLLEEQQQEFCSRFSEFSSGVCIAAPIKMARSQQGAEGTVFQERARQVCAHTDHVSTAIAVS